MNQLTAAERSTLAKLLGLTGSAHDAEALSAARKAHELVKARGNTWSDLLGAPKSCRPLANMQQWPKICSGFARLLLGRRKAEETRTDIRGTGNPLTVSAQRIGKSSCVNRSYVNRNATATLSIRCGVQPVSQAVDAKAAGEDMAIHVPSTLIPAIYLGLRGGASEPRRLKHPPGIAERPQLFNYRLRPFGNGRNGVWSLRPVQERNIPSHDSSRHCT
ncbi:hypothetical protein [Aestuariivirga sp.]|uniref:hypothetical protein n=1 Tax=Aestuariivirga sp. TaxID=2650926 RepID=UPI00391DBBCB